MTSDTENRQSRISRWLKACGKLSVTAYIWLAISAIFLTILVIALVRYPFGDNNTEDTLLSTAVIGYDDAQGYNDKDNIDSMITVAINSRVVNDYIDNADTYVAPKTTSTSVVTKMDDDVNVQQPSAEKVASEEVDAPAPTVIDPELDTPL